MEILSVNLCNNVKPVKLIYAIVYAWVDLDNLFLSYLTQKKTFLVSILSNAHLQVPMSTSIMLNYIVF